jgi:hypothetical protein
MVQHAHRHHGFGVALGLTGEARLGHLGQARIGERAAHRPLIGQRHQRHQPRARASREAQPRVHQRDDGQMEREPRQIEQGQRPGR